MFFHCISLFHMKDFCLARYFSCITFWSFLGKYIICLVSQYCVEEFLLLRIMSQNFRWFIVAAKTLQSYILFDKKLYALEHVLYDSAKSFLVRCVVSVEPSILILLWICKKNYSSMVRITTRNYFISSKTISMV